MMIFGIVITLAPNFFEGMSMMMFLTVFIGFPIFITGLVKLIKSFFEASEQNSTRNKIGKFLVILAWICLVLIILGSSFVLLFLANATS